MSVPEGSHHQLLRQIRRDYLVAKYPSHIPGLPTSDPTHLHQTTLGHSDPRHPPIQYRIAFVKHIIKQLERRGDEEEVVSVWYEALETLGGCHNQTEPFYRIYDLSRDEGQSSLLKIFESESSFVAEGTTGLVTWEASVQLSKWLMQKSPSLNPKWMGELGCGCGFLAAAVLQTFPSLETYLASDGSAAALEKCRLNVSANSGDGIKKLRTELIDWEKDEGKWSAVVESLAEQFGPGALVGADVVFDPALIPPLVALIDAFLRTSPKQQVFLASTLRNEHTFRSLQTHLQSTGKTFQVVHRWTNGEILDIKLT